jgi:fucose permease
MCVAFGIAGFGFSIQVTQDNTFVGSLENASTKLGLMHASYGRHHIALILFDTMTHSAAGGDLGLGALTAPLVATQFSMQRHWSFHYLISTSLAILNVALIVSVFRFKTADRKCEIYSIVQCRQVKNHYLEAKAQAGLASVEDSSSVSGNKYRKIMGMSAVHFLALWCLIYVGTEVTLGGT